MSNVQPVTAYAAAVRKIERLDATEDALKLALISADSLTETHIAAALHAINDQRHVYQDAITDARMALYANNSMMVDGIVMSMPQGYIAELIEDSSTAAVVWHYGAEVGRVEYDSEGDMFISMGGHVQTTPYPTRWAALRALVTLITE